MDSSSFLKIRILNRFEQQSRSFKILFGIALVGAISIWDLWFGHEITLSMFYLLPVSLVTFYVGLFPGVILSVISILFWFGADIASGLELSNRMIAVWNSMIRLSFFLIMTFLWATLRDTLERERQSARMDNLTGAANTRYFYELLNAEILRMERSNLPLTLAFMDLDNFKTVNDRFGHGAGDQVLQSVVQCIRSRMRRTDVVARLGGDEFALLLPETTEVSSREVISKIQTALKAEMNEQKWPVTFSIGVITCLDIPPSPDSIINMADKLMYSVKHSRKDDAVYSVFRNQSDS